MDNVPLSKAPKLWERRSYFLRPFRSSSSTVIENIAAVYNPLDPQHDDDEPDLKDLNNCLSALVDIFPNVQPEVFREVLVSISAESRLEIVVENLLKQQAKWVQGRYRAPERPIGQDAVLKSGSHGSELEVAPEIYFRGGKYKQAVRSTLYQEFKTLSHSTIKAVLAEQNYSYTLARPTLHHLAGRSWRFSLFSLWPRRSPSSNVVEHPCIAWVPDSNGGAATPRLKTTGCPQLDHELYSLFIGPVIDRQLQDRLMADRAFAQEVNAKEAGEADATFDCECCYNSVAFEQLSVCDEGCHYLCLECVRRTTKEALYGQGWSPTVDLGKASLRCFAPSATECHGSIPPELVQRALQDGSDSEDIWTEFQDRITEETLMKSRLQLQRCPFCKYAEAEGAPRFKRKSAAQIWYSVNKSPTGLRALLLLLIVLVFNFPVSVSLVTSLLWLVGFFVPSIHVGLRSSSLRVYKRRRGLKFRCQNSRCRRTSCICCQAIWRDPHICFESAQTSLRTTLEASATAAVKRICPRCNLSFIKSSGCNKLVCNCGYTMCYVCRQAITTDVGYSHFCQHFRPSGGKCGDCNRCDLYGDEDEDEVVRRAVEGAERAWREKEGNSGSDDPQSAAKTRAMVEVLIGAKSKIRWWEEWLDLVVDAVVA